MFPRNSSFLKFTLYILFQIMKYTILSGRCISISILIKFIIWYSWSHFLILALAFFIFLFKGISLLLFIKKWFLLFPVINVPCTFFLRRKLTNDCSSARLLYSFYLICNFVGSVFLSLNIYLIISTIENY